jgi:hypothetical protein
MQMENVYEKKYDILVFLHITYTDTDNKYILHDVAVRLHVLHSWRKRRST